MSGKGRASFIKGLCPFGASRLPRDLSLCGQSGWVKDRVPGLDTPSVLPPISVLGSRPRVALSPGWVNVFYLDVSRREEKGLTRRNFRLHWSSRSNETIGNFNNRRDIPDWSG